jgi:predicted ArsR family transcriptional regulator
MCGMSNVQTTSAAAYQGLPLNARQVSVRRAITALGAACNQQIADHLGVPVNQVTGRVFELREAGVVIESHKGLWKPTGRTVIFWKIAQGSLATASPATPGSPVELLPA